MNKRKIVLMAVALCMVAILGFGGTLAYLTDTDNATNVFTVGNVDIDLVEKYEPNSKLLPATGSAQDDTLQNGVEKRVWIENKGTENAYVRVHIAIPNVLDNGDPKFDAGKNVLHFNAEEANYQDGLWNWGKAIADNDNLPENTMVNKSNWNYYEIELPVEPVEGEKTIKYNVYVVTYEAQLLGTQGDKEQATSNLTVDAIHQVYLDSKVTNSDINQIKEKLGDKWEILVAAEGAQAAGFSDAFTALNTAFGVPSATQNPWYGYDTDDTTALPAN